MKKNIKDILEYKGILDICEEYKSIIISNYDKNFLYNFDFFNMKDLDINFIKSDKPISICNDRLSYYEDNILYNYIIIFYYNNIKELENLIYYELYNLFILYKIGDTKIPNFGSFNYKYYLSNDEIMYDLIYFSSDIIMKKHLYYYFIYKMNEKDYNFLNSLENYLRNYNTDKLSKNFFIKKSNFLSDKIYKINNKILNGEHIDISNYHSPIFYHTH